MRISRPVKFTGTEAERQANRATHVFYVDEEGRCGNCDARPSGTSSDYPCGADVPRECVERNW